MSGKTRYCEICGIKESLRGGFFANFPIDELRCKNWVRLVGKEDLVHIPIEKLHELHHVCGDHFKRRDFGKTGKRLKKRAFPKLHLTAPPLSDHQLSEFPQHVASKADCNTSKDKLLKQLKQMKTTIKSLKKIAKVMEKLYSPFLKKIVNLALKNQNRRPRRHRWTTKYKISCLAILKRSSKAYKYFKHIIKTLQNILQKVPMEPGIIPQILKHLQKAASVSSKTDKYCYLIFDEISIKPRLNYNMKRDNIDGFTDMGDDECDNTLADHALVFMLQGIRKKCKQPLAFNFVKGTVSSRELAQILKKTVQAIHETGFHVIATVCDQGPTNMGALSILRERSEEGPSIKNYFNVDGRKVFIFYDVPHLFKSLRNNLKNYGELKMGGKTVKWAHLKEVEEKIKTFYI